MTFLDKIITDTAHYDPSIVRHDNGDVSVRWRQFMYGRTIKRSRIAELVGVDADMIYSVNLAQFWELHIPKEIAESL
jgi:hypothetical protein